MDKLRVFETFSGYGSQSIALRNIGVPYEVVAISEIDKYAIKAYEIIHGEVNNLGDISKIDTKDIPEHDLFTYSFPCQDISVAGKQMSLQENSGTRSSLLWECKKIIEACKPKYLLMENVKNLVSQKHKPYFDMWLEYLETLGYVNYWDILNAKDFGVPQNRERVFVISILGEHKPYEFPKGFELKLRLKDILEDEVDEKYYVSKEIQDKFKPNKNIKDIINSPVRLGGLFDTEKGSHQAGSVWDVEKISPTLDTMQGGWRQPCIVNANSGRIRKLTPRECFRLMGLSEGDIDKIQGSKISNTQQYKMAGNSIVVNVLEEIFKNLFSN